MWEKKLIYGPQPWLPLHRRAVQRVYWNILKTWDDGNPPFAGHPKDFDTIIDFILPFHGIVVPANDRKNVRIWIDEMVDKGIFVRDCTKKRSDGDFFVINPAQQTQLANRLFDLLMNEHSPDLSPRDKIALRLLIAGDALALVIFLWKYGNPDWASKISSNLTFIGVVLGLVGLQLSQMIAGGAFSGGLSLNRTTCRYVMGMTVPLLLLLVSSKILTYKVILPPGAEVKVDGKTASPILLDGDLSYLPLNWGEHEVSVTKPYFISNESNLSTEVQRRVALPFDALRQFTGKSGPEHLSQSFIARVYVDTKSWWPEKTQPGPYRAPSQQPRKACEANDRSGECSAQDFADSTLLATREVLENWSSEAKPSLPQIEVLDDSDAEATLRIDGRLNVTKEGKIAFKVAWLKGDGATSGKMRIGTVEKEGAAIKLKPYKADATAPFINIDKTVEQIIDSILKSLQLESPEKGKPFNVRITRAVRVAKSSSKLHQTNKDASIRLNEPTAAKSQKLKAASLYTKQLINPLSEALSVTKSASVPIKNEVEETSAKFVSAAKEQGSLAVELNDSDEAKSAINHLAGLTRDSSNASNEKLTKTATETLVQLAVKAQEEYQPEIAQNAAKALLNIQGQVPDESKEHIDNAIKRIEKLGKGWKGKGYTRKEFEIYVNSLRFPVWRPKFAVIHQTTTPTFARWKSSPTDVRLVNLANFYAKELKWNRVGHLYVDDEKIWVLTPPDKQGFHAKSLSQSSWGVTLVGNYDKEPINPIVRDNAAFATAVLYRKLGVKPSATIFHRDHSAAFKHCPGANVQKAEFIERIAYFLSLPNG